jgi:hypothetical protein
MSTYKFANKGSKVSIMAIFVSILAVLIWFNADIGINKSLIYFVSSVGAFIYIVRIIRKAKTQIDEIVFVENGIKLYFYNKTQDAVYLEKDNYNFVLNENEIIINTNANNLIGKAKREVMEESDKWEELIAKLHNIN